MSSDQEPQEPERFVSVESAAGVVTVRDDTGSIEDMQETAKSLHDEAVTATLKVNSDERPRGWQ